MSAESNTCTCPSDSYLLSCETHWEIVAEALVREVGNSGVRPTGTTTMRAVATPYTEQETTNG